MLDNFAGNRQQQRTIRAGADWNPLIRNSSVTRAYRVNRNHAPAVAFEITDFDFQRVGMVVFRRTDHYEQFRMVQIGATEFPEGTADGVNHARSHVHRTETAVCRVVRCAKLFGEQAGQRLHLVTSGKQAELFRVSFTDVFEAGGEGIKRLIPRNRFKLTFTTSGIRFAFERGRQTRWRILFHNAR